MSSKLLAILLLCCAAGPLMAAEKAVKKAPPAKKPPVVKEAANPQEDLLPRSVFEVLLGEIALQRGNADVALGAYVDLARRSQDPRALARAIEIAGATQRYELALELSRQWAKVEPQSFQAQQALTTSLMLLNRTDELADQIAVMLERDKPRLAENLLYLNRMLARQPDRQAVNRLVEKVAAPYAGIAEAHYAMGLAALGAGDQVRARVESGKALELRPDWEGAALLRAQVLAKESPAQAAQLLEEFVDHNPKAADARLTLARLLLSEQKYGEARRQLDRVLEDYPNSPEVLYPAAMLALQQNDAAGGRLLLERLLASNFSDKSAVHFFLGQVDEDQKNLPAALAHYRQVTAGEHFVQARARAAQVLAQQGQVDDAVKLLKGTTGRTADEKARLAIAEAALLRDAKRYAEAYARLELALKSYPDNVDILYDTALMAERLGKMDVLEARLKRVLELKPDYAHALNALGYSWADRNLHLEEAAKLIQRARELAPKDPYIMDSMGWVLYRQGKLAEALETLEMAYKLSPDPEIAAHLGEVLWQLGRRDEALKLWRAAAEKSPGNEELLATMKKFQP
ncbi:MAG: tetratricopeptide repeat protein [Betaproteobacteria bacterium]